MLSYSFDGKQTFNLPLYHSLLIMMSIFALLSLSCPFCLARVSHTRQLYLLAPFFPFRAIQLLRKRKVNIQGNCLDCLCCVGSSVERWTWAWALPPSSCLSSALETASALMSTDSVADSLCAWRTVTAERERKIQGGGECMDCRARAAVQ